VASPRIQTQAFPALLRDSHSGGTTRGGAVRSLPQASVVNVVFVVVDSQLISAAEAIHLAVACISGRLKAWHVRGVIRGGPWGCSAVKNLVGIWWVIWSEIAVLDGKDGQPDDRQRALNWRWFRGIFLVFSQLRKT
jgi:hypothetical protein